MVKIDGAQLAPVDSRGAQVWTWGRRVGAWIAAEEALALVRVKLAKRYVEKPSP